VFLILSKMNKLRTLFSEYEIVLVLVGLVIFFSVLTIQKQHLSGEEAGKKLAAEVMTMKNQASVLLVTSNGKEDKELVHSFVNNLGTNYQIEIVDQDPIAARKRMTQFIEDKQQPDIIATSTRASRWLLFQNFKTHFPSFSQIPQIKVQTKISSNFLKIENLLNVADQITVIAIIAIGMTMVILAGGIDLSVGSLVAFSAVVCTQIIQSHMGAEQADSFDLVLAGGTAVILCGFVGLLSGTMTTIFKIPSFIVTLSMMLIASGLAYTISKGQSIYQLPANFTWLGRGRMMVIPVSVLLMFFLYFLSNLVMTKMVFGRYVYAIGGNQEASRLSGVPINKIVMAVFTICGILAGLGGVILASQLNSGSPTYGLTYELYVIAAVVVGGTSLMGGEGKIWGTLIGAFIIGVIQNGMNLIGIESYTQKVILGLLILVALLLERLRKGAGWA